MSSWYFLTFNVMIVIDGEFTGLDHKKHSLVSLGAVDFFNP